MHNVRSPIDFQPSQTRIPGCVFAFNYPILTGLDKLRRTAVNRILTEGHAPYALTLVILIGLDSTA